MKKLIPLLICGPLLAITACTPSEVARWQEWHAADPDAAVAFANLPEIQAQLQAPAPTDNISDGVVAGDCDSYGALMAAYGLPVDTFQRIAWRESGCNHRSYVSDHDDEGGGLLGINLKGRLAATWNDWCGATTGNITNAEVNIRCAAEAYQRMGMQPWG